MKISHLIYIISLIGSIWSCKNDMKSCRGGKIEYSNVILTDSKTIFLKTTKTGLCDYIHELVIGPGIVWDGHGALYKVVFKGKLYQDGDIIYLRQDNGYEMKYFDLSMRVNQIDTIYFPEDKRILQSAKDKYGLMLEAKFYEDNDTIYKFRFLNITYYNTDIVFYVNKRTGIQAVYNTANHNDTCDEIFTSVGKIEYAEDQLRKRIYSRR